MNEREKRDPSSSYFLERASTIGFLLHPGYHSWADPGSGPDLVSNKTLLKTIGPPGNPEGNTTHRMHCTVSLEIVLRGGCNAQVLAAWE
jgi:hypothetical protein